MITAIATFLAAPLAFYIVLSIVGLILFVSAVFEKGFLSFISTAAVAWLLINQNPELATNPTFLIGVAVTYLVGGLLVGRFKWSRFLANRFERTIKARDNFLEQRGIPLEVFQQNTKEAAKLLLAKQKEEKAASAKRKAFSNATVETLTPEEQEQELAAAEYHLLSEYESVLNKAGCSINVPSSKYSVAAINAAAAPKASENKASIVMWIGYWPVYLVWYLIADICKDIGTAIYNAVGGHFQRMSNEKFSNL